MSGFSDYYARPPLEPYVRERRLAGSQALALFDIVQPAGDYADPSFDDLIICMVRAAHRNNWQIDGRRKARRLGAGHVHVLKPGTACSAVIDDPNAFLVAAVPWDLASLLLDDIAPGRAFFEQGPDVDFTEGTISQTLMTILWDLARPGEEASKLVADSALLVLLHVLSVATRQAPTEAFKPSGLAAWQLKRIQDYLLARMADNVGLPELAAMTGLSTPHLCRAFKASTGLPPHRWQTLRRIEHARELLADPRLSLTEIAQRVGYSGQGPFGEAFRRHVGVSPGAYRRTRLS